MVLVIFTDRRRPSLTLPASYPHRPMAPLNLAFSTPRRSSEIGGTAPASTTLHAKGHTKGKGHTLKGLIDYH